MRPPGWGVPSLAPSGGEGCVPYTPRLPVPALTPRPAAECPPGPAPHCHLASISLASGFGFWSPAWTTLPVSSSTTTTRSTLPCEEFYGLGSRRLRGVFQPTTRAHFGEHAATPLSYKSVLAWSRSRRARTRTFTEASLEVAEKVGTRVDLQRGARGRTGVRRAGRGSSVRTGKGDTQRAPPTSLGGHSGSRREDGAAPGAAGGAGSSSAGASPTTRGRRTAGAAGRWNNARFPLTVWGPRSPR